MEEYEQKENEHYIEFIKRITLLREQYGLSYEEWCNIISKGNAQYSNDTARKAYYVLEKILPLISYNYEVSEEQKKKFYDLHSKEVQIMKEREKQKDERKAYYNLIRNESRWESLFDEIASQLENLNYNHNTNIYPYEINGEETEAILCISDWHIGVDIDTPSNKYNIDIAKERLDKLIKDTIKFCKLNNVVKLHIAIMGDITHGVIHVSSRLKQNENIISQVLIASEMLTDLVISLSQSVKRIEVYNVNGNHGRVSPNIKESIDEENFESLIYEYLKLKTEIIKLKERLGYNIKFNENLFNDIALIEINDKRIAVTHGHNDFKQLNKATDRINQLLGEYRADELIIGHLHNVRMHDNVTVNGTMSGSDNYAMNKRYNNTPAQILKVYYKDNSIVLCEIKLK